MHCGRPRPVLRDELERSAGNDLEGPVFPYPHLQATLTSWESRLDVTDASKDEVAEDAREMLRPVSSTRELRTFHPSGSRGGEVTAALVRPSSRGPGAIRIPSSGGEEPTVAAMRPPSRGPGVVRTPGFGGKEHLETTVSTMRLSSRGPEAIRGPGSRSKDHVEPPV